MKKQEEIPADDVVTQLLEKRGHQDQENKAVTSSSSDSVIDLTTLSTEDEILRIQEIQEILNERRKAIARETESGPFLFRIKWTFFVQKFFFLFVWRKTWLNFVILDRDQNSKIDPTPPLRKSCLTLPFCLVFLPPK